MTKRNLSPETRWKLGRGNRGKKRSAAAKKKTSETLKGRPKSLEHRQKIAHSRTGKPQSEETKKKISATKQRKFQEKKKRKTAKYMIDIGISSHHIAAQFNMTVSELIAFIYE